LSRTSSRPPAEPRDAGLRLGVHLGRVLLTSVTLALVLALLLAAG
jgi:hypothetical protein